MRILTFVIVLTMFCGCYSQNYIAQIEKPVSITGCKNKTFTIIKSFEVSDRSGWLIVGLVPVGHTDLAKIFDQQIKSTNGDEIINVSIETKYDFVDIAINFLTSGIYSTRNTIIKGDVIKYQ